MRLAWSPFATVWPDSVGCWKVVMGLDADDGRFADLRRLVAGADRAPEDDPPEGASAENPYTLHTELQQSMNDLVGIIRKAEEMAQALAKLDELRQRILRVTVEGHRQFNPGWHLAIDLRNMLMVSECVAKAALTRTESRGGHTRDDFPGMDAEWRHKLLVCSASDGENPVVPDIGVTVKEQVPLRQDLLELFEFGELGKYYTDAELETHPGSKA